MLQVSMVLLLLFKKVFLKAIEYESQFLNQTNLAFRIMTFRE